MILLLQKFKEDLPIFQKAKRSRRVAAFLRTALFLPLAGVSVAQQAAPYIVSLKTSDVRMEFRASSHAPRLVGISGNELLSWRNMRDEALPAAFEIDGSSVPAKWQFRGDLSSADAHQVTFIYESLTPHVRILWTWRAHANFGPIEHSITVENLGDQTIWLPMIDSFRAAWSLPEGVSLENFYVEKGADTPSPQGTHLERIGDRYRWTGHSSNYALPQPGIPREIIPADFVYQSTRPQEGWFAGIEFSGRVRIDLNRDGNNLTSTMGLDPVPGPFRTRLAPGEHFETPTIFLGAFRGGPDGAANQLRPWVRSVLGNPRTWSDPHYPYMVNNSWGSGMDVNEELALRMIAESKSLGLEMLHLDAGWFRGVGDWYPNPKKFPHGLATIADAAHRSGLRFGIWTDWTQAGTDTEPGALNVHDSTVQGWLVSRAGPEWKPEEFKGMTIDIGVAAARDYATRELERIVKDYRLDMLEHDGYLVAKGCIQTNHPHAPPDPSTMRVIHDWGGDFIVADNSTDVSYHATRSYYAIYEKLRRSYPRLIFEICNDGGRMVDFGSAAHGDYFSITDTYDPLSNRRAFYDTSYMMPAAMLESYVEKWPTPKTDNFLYMLRSGMMGWISIMQDTSAWTPEQHRVARQAFSLYKTRLRPLIRDARLYHISPRPDGVHWDGMEYFDPARGKGVVFVFRGSVADETAHRFVLAGLEYDRHYRLHFQDRSQPDRTATGRELEEQGLQLVLKDPLSSELVWLERENEVTPQ